MAQTYGIKLKQRVDVAQGTAAFSFERPPAFNFLAGQFLDMDLSAYISGAPAEVIHSFSIASAPFEGDLMIVTRLRDSAFKRTLAALPLGAEVKVEGPYGSLTPGLHAGLPAVGIAGGIGITPFRSIILQAAKDGVPDEFYLFYSVRTPAEAIFLDELTALAGEEKGLRLVVTVTGQPEGHHDWPGETGRVSLEMLARYVAPLACRHYVAGPPDMVESVRSFLQQAGVERPQLHVEKFRGY